MASPSAKIDPRISFNFEVAKVVSILVVVVAHFGLGISLWIPAAVALFVFGASSGYFTAAKYGERLSLGRYWSRKFVRMAPDILVVNVFLLCLFLIQSRTGIWTWQTAVNWLGLTGFLNWFGIPNDSPFGGGLWFFTLLLIFYAVYPVLRLWTRSRLGTAALAVVSLVTCEILNRYVPMGHALWLTAWSFLFGVAVYRLALAPTVWITAPWAVGLAALMVFLNVRLAFNAMNFYLLAGISAAVVLWLQEVRLPRKVFSPFCLLSGCILEVYFVHSYLYVRKTGYPAVDLVASLACILVVSFLLRVVAQKVGARVNHVVAPKSA